MVKTGEEPGQGLYKCTNCGQQINLEGSSDTMPPCPRCSNTSFRKVD